MIRTVDEIKRDMMDALPKYYADSRQANNVAEREAGEFNTLYTNVSDVLNQFFVDTATMSLDTWEQIFDIKYDQFDIFTWNFADESAITFNDIDGIAWDKLDTLATTERSYEDRRGPIRARIRGVGTVTPAMIKSVVKSYTNGEVEVIEDPANYMVTIKFVSNTGLPPNYEQVKRTIRDILPAHLGVTFTNEYATWNDTTRTTWGNLATHTWDEVKGGLF